MASHELTEHKHVKIFVNAYDGSFFTEEDDERAALTAPTLAELKTAIEKQARRPVEHKPGFMVDAMGWRVEKVTVTSVFEENAWGGAKVLKCWVTHPADGKRHEKAHRSKESASEVVTDSVKNQPLIAQLMALGRQQRELQDRARGLRDQLETFDPKKEEVAGG